MGEMRGSGHRGWRGPLIEQQLHPTRALLIGQGRVVLLWAGGHRHAALNGWTRAPLFKPALEIFEFVYVLSLSFPVDGPRIGGHSRVRVHVTGQIRPIRDPGGTDPK